MDRTHDTSYISFYIVLALGALLFGVLIFGLSISLGYLQQVEDLNNQLDSLRYRLSSAGSDPAQRLVFFQELETLLDSQALLRRGRIFLPEVQSYLKQVEILLSDSVHLSFASEQDEGLFQFLFSTVGIFQRSVRESLDLFRGQISILGLLLLVILAHNLALIESERRNRRWGKEAIEDLLNREEELRRLLSLELHDDIAQTLALARISGLEESRGLLGQAIAAIRGLTRNLSLPSLSDEELEFRLNELSDFYKQSGDFEILFRVSGSLSGLNRPGISVNLFRIVQELLQNAQRHSNAKTVSISIHRGAENLSLRYKDDGRGFDPVRLREGSGPGAQGLKNLRERASLFDGTVQIRTIRNGGTQIDLDIPLNNAPKRKTIPQQK